MLLQLFDTERALWQEWWYPHRSVKPPVKPVHDPLPHMRKQPLHQVQGLFADNETILLRKYAGRALLALLAQWPEEMRLSLENVSNHSLPAFLHFIGVEYFGGVSDLSIEPPAPTEFTRSMVASLFLSASTLQLKSHAGKKGLAAFMVPPAAQQPRVTAVLKVVSSELALRLQEKSELESKPGDCLASQLLDQCMEANFWLPSGAEIKSAQPDVPDFGFATWLITHGTTTTSHAIVITLLMFPLQCSTTPLAQ